MTDVNRVSRVFRHSPNHGEAHVTLSAPSTNCRSQTVNFSHVKLQRLGARATSTVPLGTSWAKRFAMTRCDAIRN